VLRAQNLNRKIKISLPEEDLVKALRARQELGARALYDMYAASLHGIVFRLVQDDELAEDLLQDVFVKIWNSFSQYDESKGRLFTWMVNIARNIAVDKLRSKDFRNNSMNQDIDLSVNAVDEQLNTGFNPEILGVKEMVNRLQPDAKNVLDLVYFKGYTQAEAAEELGLPLGTVKSRIRIAICSLRKLFN
jgi:RNA polymerase sigma factor (sigma-70 family)